MTDKVVAAVWINVDTAPILPVPEVKLRVLPDIVISPERVIVPTPDADIVIVPPVRLSVVGEPPEFKKTRFCPEIGAMVIVPPAVVMPAEEPAGVWIVNPCPLGELT